jgi:hypothetical protein
MTHAALNTFSATIAHIASSELYLEQLGALSANVNPERRQSVIEGAIIARAVVEDRVVDMLGMFSDDEICLVTEAICDKLAELRDVSNAKGRMFAARRAIYKAHLAARELALKTRKVRNAA